MVSSNLMSTMKAEFVEIATKRFIASNVLPVVDRDIAEGKMTFFKPLLRPIGFNITLQACYGKEMESLEDPLWTGWDTMTTEVAAKQQMQVFIGSIFGLTTPISFKMQRLFTGSDFMQDLEHLIDYVETLENAKDVDAEKDKNVKLFSDFVDDYVNSEHAKYTKRHVQGDMITMFLAATDTTYSVISFALLAAAKYQKIQQQLHEEVVAAFGSDVDRVQLKGGGITKIPKLRAFIQLTIFQISIFLIFPCTCIGLCCCVQ